MYVIKNIIFDFDGVILDSVPVKTEAFKTLFKEYRKDVVDQIIEYHIENGGKSRYAKIEYFFINILDIPVTKEKINSMALVYSELTKIELSKKKYLINETINFIKKNHLKYNLHIASGADDNDLKYICKHLGISSLFLSIDGSPKIKSKIVKSILINNNYISNETILIGDSKNDYEAAYENNIQFYAYNNTKLKLINNIVYIEKMDVFEKNL